MRVAHPVTLNHLAAVRTAYRRLSGLMALLIGTACHNDKSVTAPITVASVTITFPAANLGVNQTMQLTGVAKDAADRALTATLTWTSGDERVATVSQSGLVTGVAPGNVTIEATAGNQTGRGALIVYVPGAVTRLDVSSPSSLLTVGSTMPFAAAAYDAIGGLVAGRVVTWSSSASAVAAVSETGVVTAMAVGTATISATIDRTTGSSLVTVSTPVRSVSLALGQYHSCAIDVRGVAYCWGLNTWGQLGDGMLLSRATPMPVVGAQRFASLSAGGWHNCGIANDGRTLCWGANHAGGLGSTASKLCDPQADPFGEYFLCWPTPVEVTSGFRFAQVVASGENEYGFSCGLRPSGEALCWGVNTRGELGVPGAFDRLIPVPIADRRYTVLAAGGDHACGLTSAGTAECWGSNGYGELGVSSAGLCGDGNVSCNLTPVAVPAVPSLARLAASINQTCGLEGSGRLWCWGALTSTGDIGGSVNFTSLSTGSQSRHLCALTADGAAYCWGDNTDGQLGDGTGLSSGAPVLVAGSLSFTNLAVGLRHTCGVVVSGDVYCWGSGAFGQLGPGVTRSATPARVIVP